MKIEHTIVDLGCSNGVTCPAVHRLDNGSYLVRGHALGHHGSAGTLRGRLNLPEAEDAVIIPAEIIQAIREDQT